MTCDDDFSSGTPVRRRLLLAHLPGARSTSPGQPRMVAVEAAGRCSARPGHGRQVDCSRVVGRQGVGTRGPRRGCGTYTWAGRNAHQAVSQVIDSSAVLGGDGQPPLDRQPHCPFLSPGRGIVWPTAHGHSGAGEGTTPRSAVPLRCEPPRVRHSLRGVERAPPDQAREGQLARAQRRHQRRKAKRSVRRGSPRFLISPVTGARRSWTPRRSPSPVSQPTRYGPILPSRAATTTSSPPPNWPATWPSTRPTRTPTTRPTTRAR